MPATPRRPNRISVPDPHPGSAPRSGPISDAQKAAAEEAKAKAAAGAALTAQQLAAAEDRVALRYFADMKAKGKQVPAAQMAAAAPAAPAAAPTKAAPAKK